MPHALVLLVMLVAFAAGPASADEKTLHVAGQPGIEWSLPYTLGTHRGTVGPLTVDVRSDAAGTGLTSVVLRIPIESLHSGNAKRDCHLKEALGLDYSVSSYPKAHVCDGHDEFPPTGPDRLAFPAIVFEMSSDLGALKFVLPTAGQKSEVEIPGTWTIHGVSKTARVKATVSVDGANPPAIRVQGEHILSLADYGVVVKPFLMVKVEDRVDVKFSFVIDMASLK